MLTINKKKVWFTLIEIMVVISLIMIITTWLANINFWQSADKQRTALLNNNIYTIIDNVKNNSLLWRAVTTNQIVPEEWRVNISTTNSWTINTFYLSWSEWINIESLNFETDILEYISDIKCYNIDWTNETPIDWDNINVLFKLWEISFDSCPDSENRILDFKTIFKAIEKWIKINRVNWVVETY